MGAWPTTPSLAMIRSQQLLRQRFAIAGACSSSGPLPMGRLHAISRPSRSMRQCAKPNSTTAACSATAGWRNTKWLVASIREDPPRRVVAGSWPGSSQISDGVRQQPAQHVRGSRRTGKPAKPDPDGARHPIPEFGGTPRGKSLHDFDARRLSEQR